MPGHGQPGREAVASGTPPSFARIVAAGVALLMLSPLNLLPLRAADRMGAMAVPLPFLLDAAGLVLARAVTQRWSWAALLAFAASLPVWFELGKPESGVIASAVLLLYLALASIAGGLAVVRDRPHRYRWLAFRLPFGGLLVLAALVLAHA